MVFRKIKFNILIIIFTVLSQNIVNADSQVSFPKTKDCIEKQQGWKQYCDDEIKQDIEEDKKKENNQNNTFQYTKKIEDFQKMLDEAKAKAVWEPTEDNIRQYMILQMQTMNQASLFSDVWRRVVWTHPTLDYTQKRPVNNIGKQLWYSDRESKTLNTLKNINKRYGIFFVYSTSCPYCIRYSQILKDFKQTHNIEIKGISIDGKFLPGWEKNSFVNKGQLERLGIDYRTVPITVLFDNTTESIIPVGYGLMAQDEILERIYVITQTNPGEDY